MKPLTPQACGKGIALAAVAAALLFGAACDRQQPRRYWHVMKEFGRDPDVGSYEEHREASRDTVIRHLPPELAKAIDRHMQHASVEVDSAVAEITRDPRCADSAAVKRMGNAATAARGLVAEAATALKITAARLVRERDAAQPQPETPQPVSHGKEQ